MIEIHSKPGNAVLDLIHYLEERRYALREQGCTIAADELSNVISRISALRVQIATPPIINAQGQPKYQAQYNDDFNIATGSSGSLKYVATVSPHDSALADRLEKYARDVSNSNLGGSQHTCDCDEAARLLRAPSPHDSDLDKPLASLARASERLNEIADLEIIPSSLIRGEAEIVRKRVVEIRALNNGATRPRGEGEINAAQPALPESLSQEENAVTATAIENVLSDANEGFDDGDPGSDVLNAFAMNGAAAILAKYDVRAKR